MALLNAPFIVFCKVVCNVDERLFAKFMPKSLAATPAPLPAIVAIVPVRFFNLLASLEIPTISWVFVSNT